MSSLVHRETGTVHKISPRMSTSEFGAGQTQCIALSHNETEARVNTIRPVRTHYSGTWFASTLEADWAATFDALGWHWQYEPVAVTLADGTLYRPDFYLPAQRVWAEVKGPHNERIANVAELQRTLGYDEWDFASELVVVLRPPGPGESAQWHGARDDQDIVIVRCPDCGHCGFMDFNGYWTCRRHLKVGDTNKFWTKEGGALYRSGELTFTRAPRPQRRAA